MFCDWSECVMSVLSATKHSSCSQCIDTWQKSYIVYLYGSFPNAAFKTAPMFVWLTMALSRPLKKDRLALPLSTPLSSGRSMMWCLALCPQVVSQAPQHFRSSEKQATCEGCFARQFTCSVISLHYGMSRAVHLVLSVIKCSNYYCTMLRLFRRMITEDVLLVEFMYTVFARTSAESYRRWHGSLLLCNLCGVFRALVCWFGIIVLTHVCTIERKEELRFLYVTAMVTNEMGEQFGPEA